MNKIDVTQDAELPMKLLSIGKADCLRVESKINGGRSAASVADREIIASGQGRGICIKDVDFGSFKASYAIATYELQRYLPALLEKCPDGYLKLDFEASGDDQDVFGARHVWTLYK